jgi:hypothetical protein
MIGGFWSRLRRRIDNARYQRSVSLKSISLEKALEGYSNLSLDVSCWDKDLRAGGLFDTVVFTALVRAKAPKRYFEIGTGFGRSATLAALNTASDAEIYTMCIDYLDNPRIGWIFHEHALREKIQGMRGDSKTFSFDAWLGKIDFVFVDGAHDSEHVSNDTSVAFKLLAPGGWIIWHDVSAHCPGVAKALQSSDQKDEIFVIAGTAYACFKHLP